MIGALAIEQNIFFKKKRRKNPKLRINGEKCTAVHFGDGIVWIMENLKVTGAGLDIRGASFGLLVSSMDPAHVLTERVIAGGYIDHRRTTSSLPLDGGTSTAWAASFRPRHRPLRDVAAGRDVNAP